MQRQSMVCFAWHQIDCEEMFNQGATGPENPPGRPRREVQPRRGAGAEFQVLPGRQYLRQVLRADLPGVPRHGLRICRGL